MSLEEEFFGKKLKNTDLYRDIGTPMGFGPRELAPKEEVKPKLSTKERLDQQRRENHAASENNWNQIQANNTEQEKAVAFALGWMQCEATQSQGELWESLFTSETTPEQKQLVKKANAHLNNPVRQGEIVVLPTVEPTDANEQKQLYALIEEASAASKSLNALNDEELTTVNRHFEVLDYYVSNALERFKADGLPSDYYAYSSVGVGAVATGVGQHLTNINNVLQEINDLYVAQVAMASRTGGVNYGEFTSQRATLFKKLDGSFASLSKRTVQLPPQSQIRRALNLSTKSVVHNAEHIIAKGVVPNLGKRIANVAKGVSSAKGVGYVGLALGAASGAKNVIDACSIDGQGECGKTVSREIVGFGGGWLGGWVGGELAAAGTVLILGVVGVTSAPVLAVAAIGGAVVGGAAGGFAGSAGSKALADVMYEFSEEVYDSFIGQE
ncbi:hypothetical protein LYZ37_10970 [Vibrio tubiashii]|uniref:hypothetical protein n=1 Tax=Vibrio tubiashii TaxID=29498 RepID=UPI00234EB4E6|nr:hypothetical protein [Vibrio tubiashii]WCP66381.1 hypothetical protein LYZ37_10970 [Vibrio tubiashii]